MKPSKRIPFAVLLIASLACSVSGFPALDPNAISTAAAQTVIAGLTQNLPPPLGGVFTPTSALNSTATVTFTAEPPTATLTFTAGPPTATATETQTPIPIFTATSQVVLISVSVATNCRIGPGKAYDRVGALLVDKTAEVYGRNPTNEYWYIRNPDSAAQFCWVWGEYAKLTGPIQFLPVFTPPPTPTPTRTPTPTITATPSPSFTAKYVGLDSCAGWWVEIKLKNTGSIPLKSVKIDVKDNATDVVLVALSDGFTNMDGCLKTTTKDTLGSGNTFIVSAPAFAYNPSGHKLRAIITLCTQNGQKGACMSVKINFKP